MDWFPLQFWRTKCPHVVRISSATGRTAQEVLGFLTDLWSWSSSESADGILHGIGVQDLAPILGGDENLWSAVVESGWLIVGANYLQIPNWDHWLSKSAKRRTNDSLRKKMSRNCPQNVRKVSASKADKSALQERREEESIKDTPNPQKDKTPKPKTPPDESFERFWRAYPNRKAKGAAAKSWEKINPDAELFAAIMSAIEWQSKSEDWTKEGGRFIPHPATWLNQKRWEDEQTTKPPMTKAEIAAFATKMNEEARREAHNPELEDERR